MIKHLYDIFAERYYHGGEIFFYSDTHFGDLDCYKRRCEALSKRYAKKNNLNEVESEILNAYHMYMSFAINEEDLVKLCDEAQLKSINKNAHKNDTLILLGDVGDVECVKKLKAGYKVLVMGNHDKGATNYKKAYIEELQCPICGGKSFAQDFVDAREHCCTCGGCGYRVADSYIKRIKTSNRLFDEVYEGNLFISDKILLSHAPVPGTGYINLHGHDHAHNDGYCFAAEHINYTPVRLKTIVESGLLGKTTSFRRSTVDRAIERKKKREGK